MAGRRRDKGNQQAPRPDDSAQRGGTQVPAGPDDWKAIANNEEVLEAVVDHFTTLEGQRAARQSINDNIKASRSTLEARSLNGKAVKAMEAFYKMDPEQRAGWLQTVMICMKAMGTPLQIDLFDNLDEAAAPPGAQSEVEGAGSSAPH